jgi:hypothetical protein
MFAIPQEGTGHPDSNRGDECAFLFGWVAMSCLNPARRVVNGSAVGCPTVPGYWLLVDWDRRLRAAVAVANITA